jgi:uncharacterized protein YcbX
MLGEECAEVDLDRRGVWGDRLFAVRDAEGKLGSGKNSRRFRHLEGLFACRARYDGEVPEIALPDGQHVRGDDPRVHERLSEVFQTNVTLAREADVPHFDSYGIHLVSTAALAWLRERLPQSRIDERRFRPNIVIEHPGTGQPELAWIGRTLRVGGAVLKVVEPTGRCRMTTAAQSDLPFDPGVLRCIAQEAGEDFGVYAEVLRPGRIARGDQVVTA